MFDPDQEPSQPVRNPEPIEPAFPADRIEKGEKPCIPGDNIFPLEHLD